METFDSEVRGRRGKYTPFTVCETVYISGTNDWRYIRFQALDRRRQPLSDVLALRSNLSVHTAEHFMHLNLRSWSMYDAVEVYTFFPEGCFDSDSFIFHSQSRWTVSPCSSTNVHSSSCCTHWSSKTCVKPIFVLLIVLHTRSTSLQLFAIESLLSCLHTSQGSN